MPKIVTAHDRCVEFENEGFRIFDSKKGIIMCTHCNVRIDWARKDMCVKHCNGQSHRVDRRSNASVPGTSGGIKRQISIEDSIAISKITKTDKKKLIQDTCRMLLEMNIPMEKDDHPSFRRWANENIKGGC